MPTEGYTLVICEKPDAARRVSDALADGGVASVSLEGIAAFEVTHGGERLVVCAAQGHLYDASDPFDERAVYPAFDLEWFQHDAIDDSASFAARRISAIKKLASKATKFVNACDYDVEGETIGFNLLRYACGGKERTALRAKFSTLTKEELIDSFGRLEPPGQKGMASAGRTRHFVDFVWGVNLSRMLSESALVSGHRYRTVSMGRVQGPTLGFVIDREKEIRTFVPRPFWTIKGVFDHDGTKVVANYLKDKVRTKAEAERVRDECSGREGKVDKVIRTVSNVPPPPPFNIGDLQKEAFRAFGLAPNRTLQIAERLYLDALISYPRTGSQKLPPSIGYAKILRGIGAMAEYSKDAEELLRGDMRPMQGAKDDPAHPAVYPTGERGRKSLDVLEARLYDLVVRRFFSAFGRPATTENVTAHISVNGHQFRLGGRRTSSPGWLKYYGRYAAAGDVEIPSLKERDLLKVLAVETDEKFDSKPPRYNQSSLLEKMEKENLGTKATRAEIISTLINRGYVFGQSLSATDLGFSVVETMLRHAPSIVSTDLTRDIEDSLAKIEAGAQDEKELVRQTVRTIADQLIALNSAEEPIGRELDVAVAATAPAQTILGDCPICKTGKLRVIRSKTTHKRFVGCTNYTNGCRASAPLPQKGLLRTTSKPCPKCSWPVVYIVSGRSPWKLCVNMNCPSKEARRREVSAV